MRRLSRATLVSIALAIGAVCTTSRADDGALDWCAPVVIRPTERFDHWQRCNPDWSAEEIAARARLVYVGGEGMVDEPSVRPHPMTCFGEARFENVARFVRSVGALRPPGAPPLAWSLFVRTDLVMDTSAALPGFRPSFLARTSRPWASVVDFFVRDRSPACPAGGCTWSEVWGGKGRCDGGCLRERIDRAGGPGASEHVVYYLNLRDHPVYWPSAALARLDDAAYRAWLVPQLAAAHAKSGVTFIELNQKLWQWHPVLREGGLALRGPRNPDVAGLRATAGGWSAEPEGYGYPEYVAGWNALAHDLARAKVPFAVTLGRVLWDRPAFFDDPASPGVDEAASIREVAESLAAHVSVDAQGDLAGARRIAARLAGSGRSAMAIDSGCGYGGRAKR